MGLLEKRVEEYITSLESDSYVDLETTAAMRQLETFFSELCEEMRKDLLSERFFASKHVKEWFVKWFGAEPLLTVDKVEEK